MLEIPYLGIQFEECSFSRCKDMDKDLKHKIGVIMGDWDHSRSPEMAPFDRVHKSSY